MTQIQEFCELARHNMSSINDWLMLGPEPGTWGIVHESVGFIQFVEAQVSNITEWCVDILIEMSNL